MLQLLGASGAAWALLGVAGTLGAAVRLAALVRGGASMGASVGPGQVQTHRLQETTKLRHSPEQVWSLIHPAEHAPLLSPHTARGYRVPGTPDGVGEQHASVGLDGSVSVLEIVELTPERRAVTRLVSPVPPVPVRFVVELEALGDGCLYTLRQEHDAGATHGWSDEESTAWRRAAREHLERVRDVLATWQ